MRKLLFALLLAATGAQAQIQTYERSTVPPLPPQSPILYPTAYGKCTWDATHDVAACINAAIAKAAANGGGTILIPCGTFGLSSQVENHTSGVKLQGCGNGIPRDTASSSTYKAGTRLVWIGGVTASPAVLVQTAAGGTATTTYAADVVGITVDCNNICGIAIEFNGVSYSTINVGGAEATSINVYFTTPTDLEALGNQHNDIWAYSRSTHASNAPTGIYFDGGCSSCFNTSLNNIHELQVWWNKGDGVVFGNSDNNVVETLNGFPQNGGGTTTGSFAVCASSAYVAPNGLSPSNRCRALRILHTGGRGLHVTGYQTGSTFTAAGGNGGTAALAPLTIATSSGSTQSGVTLNFASTTGVNGAESVSCGGPVNGVFNGTSIANFNATTVNIAGQFTAAVPNGTSCTFTYGITPLAANGTYTLTATAPTVYTLTAPAAGTTQSGVSPASGFLTFTDMVIPWTGTASTNDSWTIVVPNPPTKVAVEFVDKENNLPNPTFESGSSGYYIASDQLYPIGWNLSCAIANLGSKTTNGGAGKANNASGQGSCTIGGSGNLASGSYSLALGGTNDAATGFGSVVTGQNNTASGIDSVVGGADALDRSRPYTNCWGNGDFATSGDSQSCSGLLKGTGSSGSAIRLTADGAAVGTTNCVNIPNNTAYELKMEIVAFDHTTVTKFASWNDISGLLTRGANLASTAVALVSAAPPVSYSGGTLTGNAMSITADTTNGCLNISWTPPTSNTDTWNVVARVQTVEVQ